LAAQFEKRSGNIIKERLSTFNGNSKLAKVGHLAGAKGVFEGWWTAYFSIRASYYGFLPLDYTYIR